MNEIEDFLIACYDSAGEDRKFMAGIIAAKRLLRRHRKDDIMYAAVSIKHMLSHDFIRGIKRAMSIYT